MITWLKKSLVSDEEKTLGEQGEEWAQEEYVKRGYTIISKNEYHKKGKRAGEIDFIAKNKNSLAFVEVKTRTAGIDRFGKGVESVNQFKQIKILKAVKLYLLKHHELQALRPHIDVVSIEVHPVRGHLPKAGAGAEWHRTSNGVDNYAYSVTILENSVEDWN